MRPCSRSHLLGTTIIKPLAIPHFAFNVFLSFNPWTYTTGVLKIINLSFMSRRSITNSHSSFLASLIFISLWIIDTEGENENTSTYYMETSDMCSRSFKVEIRNKSIPKVTWSFLQFLELSHLPKILLICQQLLNCLLENLIHRDAEMLCPEVSCITEVTESLCTPHCICNSETASVRRGLHT